MKYARIIDKGECMSTLHTIPQFPWPEAFLKDVANKIEWGKHSFYPSNDLVAEVPYTINVGLHTIYILRINEQFYVPMTSNGIHMISEDEYRKCRPQNNIRGMDARQRRINYSYDFWTTFNKKL